MLFIGRHNNRSLAGFGASAPGASVCRVQSIDLFVADQSGHENKLVMN